MILKISPGANSKAFVSHIFVHRYKNIAVDSTNACQSAVFHVDLIYPCQRTCHIDIADASQTAAIRPGDYFRSIDGFNFACTKGYLIGSCCSTICTDSNTTFKC